MRTVDMPITMLDMRSNSRRKCIVGIFFVVFVVSILGYMYTHGDDEIGHSLSMTKEHTSGEMTEVQTLPRYDNRQDNLIISPSNMSKWPLSEHTERIMRAALRSNPWMNTERRGDYLVLSDSICFKMEKPTNNTDVKSYPGIRVEETTRLLVHYPTIVEGYKLIMLHLGTNNLLSRDENTKQHFSVTDIHNLYLELRDMILNINTDCVVIASAILPRERDPKLTLDKLTRVNTMLDDSFGERFVHTDHGFMFDTKSSRFKVDLYHDGLHLSEKGKAFLCDKFRQVVTNYTGQSIHKIEQI